MYKAKCRMCGMYYEAEEDVELGYCKPCQRLREPPGQPLDLFWVAVVLFLAYRLLTFINCYFDSTGGADPLIVLEAARQWSAGNAPAVPWFHGSIAGFDQILWNHWGQVCLYYFPVNWFDFHVSAFSLFRYPEELVLVGVVAYVIHTHAPKEYRLACFALVVLDPCFLEGTFGTWNQALAYIPAMLGLHFAIQSRMGLAALFAALSPVMLAQLGVPVWFCILACCSLKESWRFVLISLVVWIVAALPMGFEGVSVAISAATGYAGVNGTANLHWFKDLCLFWHALPDQFFPVVISLGPVAWLLVIASQDTSRHRSMIIRCFLAWVLVAACLSTSNILAKRLYWLYPFAVAFLVPRLKSVQPWAWGLAASSMVCQGVYHLGFIPWPYVTTVMFCSMFAMAGFIPSRLTFLAVVPLLIGAKTIASGCQIPTGPRREPIMERRLKEIIEKEGGNLILTDYPQRWLYPANVESQILYLYRGMGGTRPRAADRIMLSVGANYRHSEINQNASVGSVVAYDGHLYHIIREYETPGSTLTVGEPK